MKWLLLLLAGPMIELWFLIEVGGWIGGFTTVALVVLTAVIGITLIRAEGFSTLMRAQQKLATGEAPALEMIEGVMLAIAGVMLLFPGFISDTFGFLLLITPLRLAIAERVVAKTGHRMSGMGGMNGMGGFQQADSGTRSGSENPRGRTTIDGDYERLD